MAKSAQCDLIPRIAVLLVWFRVGGVAPLSLKSPLRIALAGRPQQYLAKQERITIRKIFSNGCDGRSLNNSARSCNTPSLLRNPDQPRLKHSKDISSLTAAEETQHSSINSFKALCAVEHRWTELFEAFDSFNVLAWVRLPGELFRSARRRQRSLPSCLEMS